MTPSRFHFETAAQWATCLFVQADGQALRRHGSVQPFPAYAHEPVRVESAGAYAPAVAGTGDILWRDAQGWLRRLAACDDQPERFAPRAPIATAQRLVANRRGVWVLSHNGDALHLFEDETFSRVLAIDLGDMTAIDIADAGRGHLLVLGRRNGALQVVTVGSTGHAGHPTTLHGLSSALALTYLRHARRLVVLGVSCERRLFWFEFDGARCTAEAGAADRQPLFSRAVAALRPCFGATALGSDGKDRLVLAGHDDASFGGASYVLVLDADGTLLGEVPLDAADAPATGVVAAGGALLVTGSRGLLRFGTADAVPEGVGGLRAMLLTPMLSAPDRDDRRRWLRVEATAALPEGTSLEIAFAHTADVSLRDRLIALTKHPKATASERLAAVRDEPDLWRDATVFHGRAASGTATADPYSAKLFDVRDPYVWVLVTLRAAPGARLPVLSTLDVLYPGRTLMEHLPSIYQREEDRPDSFLRSLVGVLEATTDGTDARIRAMSGRLSPQTANTAWLDFVASWLGVPWDQAMSDPQKRRVLAAAPLLARERGTRAGLEALLDSLLPAEAGTPRRYRVTDLTADFGFARVGDGGSCLGSALPAMLGGRTRSSTELGRDSILGRMRLPCPGEPADGVRHLAGRISVEIAATAEQRHAMEPWLDAVLGDMLPLGVRLSLRWVPPQALRGTRLDGTLTLDGPPSTHLGNGAITGLARLPRRGGRLSRSGPALSTPLR